MNRMKSKILIIIVLAGLLLSCNKILDVNPQSEISDNDVWRDPALAETFINNIYNSIDNPPNGGDGVLVGQFVDEMHDQWYSFAEFHNSLITPDFLGAYDWFHADWGDFYKSIRSCNIFLENIDRVPFREGDETLKNRMIGEVVFLRALVYHQITSLYGGVPLITKAYTLDDDFEIERNSYKDCIDFIASECDKAAALLPLSHSGDNIGRATKGAALALKSRTLLYAASDLHNVTVFPGYAHPELLGYTDGNRQARWTAAKNAAKAVMDLNKYSLYKGEPSPGDSIPLNLQEIFITKQTEEDIFVRFYTAKSRGNRLPLVAGPNGYHLYGEDTPIGEMVDDYEMADGTPFSWNNPVHAEQPYKNREPRFYADILYEGAYFKPRPLDVQPLDPVGVIQVGTWEKWDAATNSIVEVYGLDSRKSVIDNFNGGFTGYYLRKLIDPAVDGQYFAQDVPWRYIRYAEILLNYAEACIELGQDEEARTYINKIRKRAGMPDVTASGAELREKCRHERRIELAFEDHRFYDVRRWLIGPQAYQQLSGVKPVYKLQPDKTTATIPVITTFVVQDANWLDKAYFFPIYRDEMNKNSLLVQNPDYE